MNYERLRQELKQRFIDEAQERKGLCRLSVGFSMTGFYNSEQFDWVESCWYVGEQIVQCNLYRSDDPTGFFWRTISIDMDMCLSEIFKEAKERDDEHH